jgi:hypothetical protein
VVRPGEGGGEGEGKEEGEGEKDEREGKRCERTEVTDVVSDVGELNPPFSGTLGLQC